MPRPERHSEEESYLKQQNPSDINRRRQHSEALKEYKKYKKLCNTKKAIFEDNQIN